MKPIKSTTILFLVATFGMLSLGQNCMAVSQAQPTVVRISLPGLGGVYKISTHKGTVYLSGAPSKQGLNQLKQWRVKTLVDFRSPKEANFDEGKALKKLAIDYKNIPVNLKNFNPQSIQRLSKILNNRNNYPLYLHCSTGNRAAIMLTLYNIKENNLSVNQALSEARHFGLTRPSAMEFIKRIAY